ncbi:hypothetical protein [uncultured Aquitalea sp.]|uniref:hypothetical protein n=1 Tax=uncultured Aquitalea sp. TaxID=540272 RepID=UPI0025EF2361|nr:hypothetical protein [uncultured Aquitalea sp.]
MDPETFMGATEGLMDSGGGGGGGGSWFDGWNTVLQNTVGYAAKSVIDAEYNYPHDIAQRQLALQGNDGETFTAGDVKKSTVTKAMPWLLIGGGLVLAVLLLRK